jgi:geranylgeranyl diphosphate synthase type II
MTKRVNKKLEERFTNLIKGRPKEEVWLLSAMEYSVRSGGKRLRPLLTLSAAIATGGTETNAMNGALAVELIHTYSLIHDDLPALDNDTLRRGKPTSHIAFGESTAILAGDALQSLAFSILAEDMRHVSHRRRLKAVETLAAAIGPSGMVGGQAMDLAFETKHPPFEAYRLMVEGKTACLISASLCLGCILGKGTPEDLNIMSAIGLPAGTAFQIVDDILNSEGDPKLMGKAVGTDAKKGKASILDHMDAEAAQALARKLIADTLEKAQVYKCPTLELSLLSLVDRLF